MRGTLLLAALAATLFGANPAAAQSVIMAPPEAAHAAPSRPDMPSRTFSMNELVDAGHKFFGTATRGLAGAIQQAISRWGEPNGYVLGEEGSGAVIGGVRYGEGKLYTRDYGDRRIFWQGPSIGFDLGGDGARTMMLVYNLHGPQQIHQRFAGVDGSVYVVGGFGLTALMADNMVVVPIRSGVGARLGLNIGYLKFTANPTWNPF